MSNRGLIQSNGIGYYVYSKKTYINIYNSSSGLGIMGFDINHYFYDDGTTLSVSHYGIDGELDKLRYRISKDSSVYIMGFYL